MDIKPETVAAVKKLVALAEKIDKAKKTIDADFKGVKQELPEAIKARQRSMIDLHMATLEALIGQTTDTLADADSAIEALARGEEDEDFLAERGRREPVEKAGHQVTDANDALMVIFTEAKRLQNVAEKARALAKGAEQDRMRELVRLDRGIKAHRKEAKNLHQQSETIGKEAQLDTDGRALEATLIKRKVIVA